jgi:uncharacterized protein YggE
MKLLMTIAGIMTLVALAAACGDGDVSSQSTAGSEMVDDSSGLGLSEMAQVFSGAASGAAGGQAGIWVTGQGSVTMEPDLALLNLGVEAQSETVKAAREEAAVAMTAVIDALKAQGVADVDIQTHSFNVFPRYDYVEEVENGRRMSKEVLAGYRVRNLATVKVRDLDGVGEAIDAVVDAGGDAVRINGISFTVEDPSSFAASLRQDAVADALAKAEHFASLTGVSLGRLVHVREVGGVEPSVQDFRRVSFGLEMAAADTISPVAGGELELHMFVQAVFEIQ